MRPERINTGIIVAMLFIACNSIIAQKTKNDFQSRTNLELSFKPLKKLRLNLSPEFRFDDNYSLDKYLIESEAEY